MVESLPSKQVVVGSSPISRSIRRSRGACLSHFNLESLLPQYELSCQAKSFSSKTISHVRSCVNLFNEFLGGIDEVSRVTGDDLRWFIAWLRSKMVWDGIHPQKNNKLSPVTVNTYARGVKAFWRWLQVEAIIVNNPLAGISAPNIPRKLPRIFSEDALDI